ncbi:MAG TPA: cytochrome c, partial [Rhizomicrobium sp.]|nr:cytochrome c [Rhizomicrobium sp.]
MPTQIRSLALTIAILWTGHSAALAQDSTIVSAGAVEFFNSCSACHGTDARGSGPIANSLKVKPA